jgi:hypothetical protein
LFGGVERFFFKLNPKCCSRFQSAVTLNSMANSRCRRRWSSTKVKSFCSAIQVRRVSSCPASLERR